jgi:DNA excision repair protein ERCC-2
MNSTKKTISISVRNLVEFIYREGDIDSGFSSNSMHEGAKLHRKIQKAQNGKYEAEVSLKYAVENEHYTLLIEGRADGIIEDENGGFCVDEIKTVSMPLDEIDSEYNGVHWAQVKCYAFIFALQKSLTQIDIRLTYCHHETEQIKFFTKSLSIQDLNKFFNDLIDSYHAWALMSVHWIVKRDESVKNLQFPFLSYRTGQRELAIEVFKTIRDQKKLFVKAPTGIGKTISTVFPALKALGEGKTSKLFYLTAKTITRGVVEDALEIMRKQQLSVKSVVLTAKEKICSNVIFRCNPIDCHCAKGHYDRINGALWKLINDQDAFCMNVIQAYAEKFAVCPFELALDLTIWSDVVICDYNYVFDPVVNLKRFFSDKGGNYTFLVDEAHNLVDRAREMFSAEITKKELHQIKKILKTQNKGLNKEIVSQLNACNSIMIRYRKEGALEGTVVFKEIQSEFIERLRGFADSCKKALARQDEISKDENIVSAYFNAIMFLKIAELYDERYVTCIEVQDDDVKIKMFCIDPSFLLQEAVKRGRSAVFFSATLSPFQYFRQILGGESNDKFLSLNSPFDKNNRCILITRDISSRYVNRESNITRVIACIKDVVQSKIGNYIVFFPSYAYMKKVYDVIVPDFIDTTVHVQSNSMSEVERERFLNYFQPNPDTTTLGFCVLGGLFSEGIDLKSDRLIGALIIGVGLPQICFERDIIKNYFQKNKSQGFEYAYIYPGMNKVLQAAGRVIRSENDKGIIILIDDRFSTQQYSSLFPEDWFPHQKVHAKKIAEHVQNFWKKK